MKVAILLIFTSALKQVDEDGRFVFSNIITVTFNSGGINYKLYPNPASGIIHISVPTATIASAVTIYDTQGKALLQLEVSSGTAIVNIDVSKLAGGLYQVKWQQRNQKQTWKLLKY